MRASWNNPRGSITLVALCLAIIMGISLASYIGLCQQSLLLSTRSLQLNKARQLAETGLEEALWSLNTAADPNAIVSATAWTNATWTTSGLDKSCTLSGYTLGNGTTGQITITIENFNGPTATPAIPNPTITATATVNSPNLGDFTKTLKVTTKPAPLFPNAIGALNGYVLLRGGTVVDSWDSDFDPTAIAPTPSRDYNKFTAPVSYSSVPHPPTSTDSNNYAAVVAAPNVTLTVGATIYGYAATFGNLIGTSASCLIKGPATPALTNIDQSRVGKSAFIPSFTVKAPGPTTPDIWHYLPKYADWSTSTPVSIGSSLNTPEYWHTDTSTFAEDNLILDSTKKLEINGYVILVVQKDLELRDMAQIEINPNSRLEIYVRDDVRITSANANCFWNRTNEPKNLALFCTREAAGLFAFIYDSSALLSYFNGVIFSADDNETLEFKPSIDIQGAISTGYTPNFSAGGYTTIHYDTALQYLPKGWFKGVATPFMITQLTEIP